MAKTGFRVEGNRLILSAVLGKEDTYKVTRNKNIFSVSIFRKPEWATGVTSMTMDNKHILLLDYDDTLKSVMLKDLANLSAEGVDAPFYIFTTKEKKEGSDKIGNYHIICPQKFTVNDIIKLQGMTNCDYAYRTMPTRNPYKSWVIRVSGKGQRPKPRFLGVVGDKPNIEVEVSRAHINLLYKLYPDIPRQVFYRNQDKYTTFYLNRYETLSRVN